ncbi:hypothetical protein IT072_09770 [Leifsonia sp. ZF2019]|uniref:hypothetical protein n=1 Tax=Leifsonia sp. ZF2019 TaxID=2781978 RepID=UPI001CBB0AD2|nr:hypothetical protein [Leifsonia sp. ZF2019]UAJ81233.1 hypothetical protein IT072_09770 [Leifsonia sp. ZF2019]
MYTFLVDETNKDASQGEFFIVGGLVFDEAQIALVHSAVAKQRRIAGYRHGQSFKFDTNSRPASVSIEQHRTAKRDLIADLKDIGVRMIVSLVLHDLCRDQSYDTRMEWALNTLAGSYRKLLVDERQTGIMLMDRDNDRYDHLEYLHQHGLKMHTGSHVRVDDRIRLFGMTSDNASHLSSAADISLGAFRYCANTAGGNGREPVAREMFPNLAQLLWTKKHPTGEMRAGGFGYLPRPKREHISVSWMLDRYDNLAAGLNSYVIPG